MIGPRDLPGRLRWTALLGLLGLVLAVPFSAPGGTGMQWDELVLGSVATSCAVVVVRRLRTLEPAAARPWWPVAVGAGCFAVAQFLAGAFPGPAFDGFGLDEVLLVVGAATPLVTAGLLARRVIRTRWSALVVDGTVVATAVLVVTEVLRAPLVNPAGAPEDLRTLVLLYGCHAALMLGAGGAVCTVSTAGLRRSVTTLMAAIAAQSVGAGAEAMSIVSPGTFWTAVSDLSVAISLLATALAVVLAPAAFTERSARAAAPVVSPVGLLLVVAALLALPASTLYMDLRGEGHSVLADLGMAVVFVLMAGRVVLRIREDGRMTEDLVRNEEDFRELIEASSDGIAIMDAGFRLLFTSPAARSLLGVRADDAEVSLLELVAPEDRELLRLATLDHPAGEGPPLQFRVPLDGGLRRELEVTSSERPGGSRRVLYLRDVTTRRRRERELERMAYTDHLTGLANRAMLFQELAAPAPEERCLLIVDLDGFKAVNDVAGHEAGDQLLVDVARRLHTVVREDDLVARLGGDEFAVLVSGTLPDGEDVAQRVVDVMAMPFRSGGHTFATGASVGVAPLTAAGGQSAFREADAALRSAKRAGKGCVRLAGEDLREGVEQGPDFDDVVAEGVFTVRLDAACGPGRRIEMVHAVPTWSHPEHEDVRGLELWGFADRQGRAGELQTWLLHEACHVAAGLPDEEVAVAVSLPAGLVTVDGLATTVAGALAASGLPATRLVLSFTEETLLISSAGLVPELEAVRRTGVRLCLDNYGMGHSIFALLARVALDLVRVDLTALAARDDTTRALQVLAAIARTSGGFGLTSIAGGISTPELCDAAFAVGVHLVHGRALPHDLSPDDLARRVAVVPSA
ncbi:PAS domain S-box-containing protein/diguanylate cyclase (GGDEF) domain-containing protein [Blastococcus sp. DSM 46786]|uniref:diguanylate cyclase domain-containing protein n=1 Tax=Blastococcus sp. DSM 46786 TaxID=1798227 RepID=UPI0008B178FF|nr:diguanylate cyclase [Blastococcus sp. DSM 46786]SEL65089.1 PAS domain S-box-containing protein/diguanylate cyclase (GGDEF) domain-containing protein [Blastococcus sp. DSM 46786]